jgi:magnesium chelatase family protein
MLARRLGTILPPLSLPEALEVTAVQSVAGLLGGRPLVATPPFRAPHHTVSHAGLVGGGTHPRPGEVALAHKGVLFLDELPEFTRAALEALREPLEEARVTIARAGGSASFPTDVMLVAAMNPCPCGHFGSAQRACTCVLPRIARYRTRISGPLLDRIDLHVEVAPVSFEDIDGPPGEASAAVAGRVRQARDRRRALRPASNQELSGLELRRVAAMTPQAQALLGQAMRGLGLSARAHDRLLRVARTIADLAGETAIGPPQLAEALTYRRCDPDTNL